jgi:hypothetical protein
MADEVNQQGPVAEPTPPKALTVVPEGHTRLFRDLDGYWAIGEHRIDLLVEENGWWISGLFGEKRELNILNGERDVYILTFLTGDIGKVQLGIYDQSDVIPKRIELRDVDEVILPSQHPVWKFFQATERKATL